jgi:hypothetical protein
MNDTGWMNEKAHQVWQQRHEHEDDGWMTAGMDE